MSSNIKPIKVYGQGGPNPPKVAIILEELGLPHEIIATAFSDVKKPEYLALNPNGRLPTIQDPNTGLTLWESGAIVEYLIERYDTAHQLSFAPGSAESYLAKQWLFFQTTGQGPYYGQAVWFKKFSPEQVPLANARYSAEAKRVTAVLEGHLAAQKQEHGGTDGPWLVGNKISYADIAFIPWQRVIAAVLTDDFNADDFPHVQEWIGKMAERKAVKSVLASAGF